MDDLFNNEDSACTWKLADHQKNFRVGSVSAFELSDC